MAKDFVISLMSRDRVGIVAAATRGILDLDGNIDAISQTVVRGYFTLILTVGFRLDQNEETIRKAVEACGAAGEFAVSVKPRAPQQEKAGAQDGDQFVLTIVGKDRPGVISRITAYLAGRSINIVDLYAYTQADEFVMISQVMIPKRLDVRQIHIDLEGLQMGGDLAIRLQHEDVFVATNEIEFRHKGIRPS